MFAITKTLIVFVAIIFSSTAFYTGTVMKCGENEEYKRCGGKIGGTFSRYNTRLNELTKLIIGSEIHSRK
jgi:hypothetical protein